MTADQTRYCTPSVAPTAHARLAAWVHEIAALTRPSAICWRLGPDEEFSFVLEPDTLRRSKSARSSNFLAETSVPADKRTVSYLCSNREADAGPVHSWVEPGAMRKRLIDLFKDCMVGRTMYVVPFCLGPPGSLLESVVIELTDCASRAATARLGVRTGKQALDRLGYDDFFIPSVHSVGVPLKERSTNPWLRQKNCTVHFPESSEVWAYGAAADETVYPLRVAGVLARDEGWLAERMWIVKLTSPSGVVKHFAAACPNPATACFSPDQRIFDGWTLEVVGADCCWMWLGADGQMRAVAPSPMPPDRGALSEHQRATIPRVSADPAGVPISAIVFGGGQPGAAPLVAEAFNWEHGVFMAFWLAFATEANRGPLQGDATSMLPSCDYNMGDYYAHWLNVGANAIDPAKLPKMFVVDGLLGDGEFVWPGDSKSTRVLKWIFARLDGEADVIDTAWGRVPAKGSLEVSGANLSDEMPDLLLRDREVWREEKLLIPALDERFGDRLPPALRSQCLALIARLGIDASV